MTLVARLNLEGIDAYAVPNVLPSVCGRRDLGRIVEQHTYPEPGNLFTGLPIVASPSSLMPTPCLRIDPFIGRASSFALGIGSTTSTYSASWWMSVYDFPGQLQDDRFMWAMEGATRRWGLMIYGDASYPFWPWDPPHDYGRVFRIAIVDPNGNPIGAVPSYQWSTNNPARFEVSVTAGVVKLEVRLGASSTPVVSITRTPAAVAADRISLGTRPEFASGHLATVKYVDAVHVWDTSNGDGNLPNFTYTLPAWRAAEWDGTTEQPLTIEGYIANTGDTVATSLAAMLADTGPRSALASREVVPPASSYVDQSYGAKTGQWYRLWTPTTGAPAGGWPVLLFVHLNYFLSTNPAAINAQFRDNMLAAGIAVASVGVNPSYLTTGSYDAVNNGKFPSHLLDVKRALRHVQANAGALGIDAGRTLLGGHSSAGYCALGAMLTRDLDATGLIAGGVDFRLGGGADPDCRGVVVLSAPIDMAAIRAADPTHPNYGTPVNLYGVGAIYSAAAALVGSQANNATANLAGTNLADLVALNAARLRPIRYHYSASDWIVPAALNVPPLVTAMATAGASSLLTTFLEDSPNHDQIPQELEMHTITEWLRSLL